MSGIETACRACPLNNDCDTHLIPQRFVSGELITYSSQYECPSYTCNDGRIDARKALQTKKPKKYKVVINNRLFVIGAVSFGQSFQKFKGVIVSFPEGNIYSLSPESKNIYYRTGQSAFFHK